MGNPYLLPDGNVQIAFSGGRTSAYMLRQILDANGALPDRVQVTFQNTGREMPQTLDFVAEVGARWGVNIVWLEYRPTKPLFEVVSHNSASRNGEPFDALIDKKRILPNIKQRSCTQELKIRTAKRYLVSIGWKKWTNATGIRADEKSRLVNLPRSWSPVGEWVQIEGKKKKEWVGEPRARDRWIHWTPLNDAGVSSRVVGDFWKRQPFDLNLPNVNGNCWLGNCDGCFLKSEANLAALARDFPERAAWWEAAEARIVNGKNRRFRRKENAQFSIRYSRSELRSFIERQGDMVFSTEGALCQADGGDCIA